MKENGPEKEVITNPYRSIDAFREYVAENGFPNGHLIGRPLSVDSEQFANRDEEIQKIFEFLRNGDSLLVWGESMSGKTSLMRRVIKQGEEEFPDYYFNNQYTEPIDFLLDESEKASDNSLERIVRKIVERCPVTKKFNKYVFTIDEASNIERLSKLKNLKSIIAKVLETDEENIILLLVGHQPVEKIVKPKIEKGLKSRIKSMFTRQTKYELPYWYPQKQMFLEPIVPTGYFPVHA